MTIGALAADSVSIVLNVGVRAYASTLRSRGTAPSAVHSLYAFMGIGRETVLSAVHPFYVFTAHRFVFVLNAVGMHCVATNDEGLTVQYVLQVLYAFMILGETNAGYVHQTSFASTVY